MADLVIATFPGEPAVLSGQSLTVRTVLDNRGNEAAEVPSRGIPSQFAYILRSQKEGGPVYGLSQTATDRRRSPDRISLPPFEPEPLPAGAKFEWQEDIADFWPEGFEPGKYMLTVRYDRGGLESPKSEVTVLPLVVESFSSFVSEDHLSSVAAHRRQDGQVAILQRESEVLDPREGVFRVRHVLPKGGPVGVATAIDVVPAGNGRWFAWLREGKLTASVGLGNRVLLTAQPVSAGGVLLSPGFQVAVGTALFGVVSGSRLDTYLAASTGLKKHWSAELAGAGEKVHWNAQPDGSVTLAWEESGTGRVLRRSFGQDGKPREAAPQAVTPGRPAAWGLPASGAPVVWAVVANGAELVLAKLPPAGERLLTRLPALDGVREWDFHEAPQGNSVVVTVVEDRIHAARLQNPQWQVIRDQGKVQSVNVVSLDGRALWVEWIEPGFGVRRTRVP